MITAGMMSSKRDDWETPQDLFDRLDAEYGFTLDPCSTDGNAKCAKHYTREDDGLSKPWDGEIVFCNPPYGREIGKWIRKMREEADKGVRIVACLPARTDTRAFHECIYGKDATRIEFLKGRLKFELGGGLAQQRPVPLDARVLQPVRTRRVMA